MTQNYDLVLPSYAKINLGLYILGKREDGYHNIWTIFQELEFHDTLFFSTHCDTLTITTSHPTLSEGKDNLIYKAVQLLKKEANCPEHVAIHLEKNIPLGAGLGGGSSNAAMTLLGLNRLFQLGLSQETLISLGAELGSDVPFFLYGGAALATGRGEEIQPLPRFPKFWILLIYPKIEISSGWAYKNLKIKLTKIQPISTVLSQLRELKITGSQKTPLKNMLEEPVMERYPIIRSIKAQLIKNGAEWALMSGSGSTVFGIFAEKKLAEHALRQMEQPDWLMVVSGMR